MTERIILDVRGLEPPEPMERALLALATLRETDTLVMLIDREPRPLLRILERDGYRHTVQYGADVPCTIEIYKLKCVA